MLGSYAKDIPADVASKAGKNFYYQRINQKEPTDYNSITLELIKTRIYKNETCYYAFDVNAGQGFILVSADDAVKPILAYSDESGFNAGNMHPGQADLLKYYAAQVHYVKTNQIKSDACAQADWRKLLQYKPENGIKETRGVEPLMLVTWNQDWPYNGLCPEDAGGSNGHVYVGCVATAMCQVMKYYNYPETGEGQKTHSSWWNGGYGNITINFSQENYNWYAMPNDVNYFNEDVAKINFHAGVAVSMYWGPDGSASSTANIEDALEDYYKYDTDCQVVSKSGYTESNWISLLKGQLDEGMPLVYSGSPSSGAGHAWNCDGYDDDEFHMNWGWSGYGNGYYTLDNLNSSATPGGEENNMIYNQQAVINIYPRSGYPEYCSGTITINASEGAFEDGSSNENYQSDQSCQYLIQPPCGSSVQLIFDRFDLGNGDELRIYDGSSTSSPLLETFDNANPPAGSVSGSSENMLLVFDTDDSDTGEGWYAHFHTEYCRMNASSTAPSGTVTDGSGPSCEYENSTVCSWKIEPEGAQQITLKFTEFDLAGNIDYLTIYKNSLGDANKIAEYNASNPPPAELTVNAPVVAMVFFTDGSDVGDGWTIDYTSSESDIATNTVLNSVEVFPNPSQGDIFLNFNMRKAEQLSLKLYDVCGKQLASTKQQFSSGYHQIRLNDYLHMPESGIYFLEVRNDTKRVLKKISLVK